jgi:uncharacterized protein (TIGR02118 family)
MHKMVILARRQPGTTLDQYRHYWQNSHGPLVASVARDLGLRRYVQSVRLESEAMQKFAEMRGLDLSYDSLSELWFDSEEAMFAALSTPAGRRASELLAIDEARFVDFHNVLGFMSTEHTVVDDTLH